MPWKTGCWNGDLTSRCGSPPLNVTATSGAGDDVLAVDFAGGAVLPVRPGRLARPGSGLCQGLTFPTPAPIIRWEF
jgi:hypothetical protein